MLQSFNSMLIISLYCRLMTLAISRLSAEVLNRPTNGAIRYVKLLQFYSIVECVCSIYTYHKVSTM